MDECRKWLTKWRLKSADWSVERDSHVGTSGLKGPGSPVCCCAYVLGGFALVVILN